ncbi:hypothetical protein RRG08_004139 [Elysia crispata]|uniref:Uncharacterized protein n=1 Tax=Elysia crispata TaxID=231223 RepID=A0AAE0YW26_9GAST|nr:hypothetical protein RRG08_004139 [Elysia crispata]
MPATVMISGFKVARQSRKDSPTLRVEAQPRSSSWRHRLTLLCCATRVSTTCFETLAGDDFSGASVVNERGRRNGVGEQNKETRCEVCRCRILFGLEVTEDICKYATHATTPMTWLPTCRSLQIQKDLCVTNGH